MKRIFDLSCMSLACGTLIAAFSTIGVGAAWAETWLCVPKTAGKAVTSGGTAKEAKCEAENTAVEQPSAAEQATLLSILPYIKFLASGIGGKPTIQLDAVNLQIINGEGKTATTNGAGNLVIGYDETPGTQTGSHDLILGGKQAFTSYGGILAGYSNTISGLWASVTGGIKNTASGELSSVSGGNTNTASKEYASVSGGEGNTASGLSAWVGGGESNTANKGGTSVSGGYSNTAEGSDASVTGGWSNKATGSKASVSGGYNNTASGYISSIFGSKNLLASGEYEALP